MDLLSYLGANFFGKEVEGKELRERAGLEHLLRTLDHALRAGSPKIVVFSAPTGYGKSLVMVGVAEYLAREAPHGISKLIHVLPMRSMVEDLASRARKVLSASVSSTSLARILGPWVEVWVDRDLEYLIWRSYLQKLRIEVGAQCSSPLGSLKDPTFLRDYVVTTLDSYTLNLFKVTVLQYTPFAHYEMPRAHVYTALNVFDEAHLFVEEGRPFVALTASLACLHEASLPSLVLTATMPTHLVRAVQHALTTLGVGPEHFVAIYVAGEDPRGDFPKRRPKGMNLVEDSDWLNATLSVKYVTILEGSRRRVIDGVLGESPSHERTLIVENTPGRAVETLKEVLRRGERAVLIHGRMRSIDRYALASKLKEFEGVIVATQVVEAGVDLDADLMATDSAPMPQLVQRLGRLCRDLDEHQGEECKVWILYEGGEGGRYGPYDAELVELSFEVLSKAVRDYGEEGVLWRSPSFGEITLGAGRRATTYLRVLECWAERASLEAKLALTESDRLMIEVLRGIDSLVRARSDHAKELLRRFGSFVREYPMIPVVLVRGVDRDLLSSGSLQDIVEGLESGLEEEVEWYRRAGVEVREWDLASIASTYFSVQLDARTLRRRLDEVCFERRGRHVAVLLSEEGVLKLHLESAPVFERLLDSVVGGSAEELFGYLDRLAQRYRATPIGVLAPWDERKLFVEGFEYPIGLV